MDLQQVLCKTCHDDLSEAIKKANDGYVKCPTCGNIWTLPNKHTTNECKQYIIMGEHFLDMGKFDDAMGSFNRAKDKDESEPEVYWGMVKAEYGIQYLPDFREGEKVSQPICHKLTNKKVIENKNYLKAIELSTGVQQETYQKKAKEIDYINEEINNIKKTGLDYDCFICTKVTDDVTKEKTQDSKYADSIYDLLKRKGYTPFYSEREIFNKQGSDYEAQILWALLSSECMLVVCTNEEYLNTPWVKNEYTRFLEMQENEEKESDSLTIIFYNNPIEKLPNKTGKIEGINYSQRIADELIVDFVEKHTPEAKKRREEEKRQKEEEQQKHQQDLINLNKKMENLTKSGEATIFSLLERANSFLSYGEYHNAIEKYDLVLDSDSTCAEAYWGLFLSNFNVTNEERILKNIMASNDDLKIIQDIKRIVNNVNYEYAKKYATDDLKVRINDFNEKISTIVNNNYLKIANNFNNLNKEYKKIDEDINNLIQMRNDSIKDSDKKYIKNINGNFYKDEKPMGNAFLSFLLVILPLLGIASFIIIGIIEKFDNPPKTHITILDDYIQWTSNPGLKILILIIFWLLIWLCFKLIDKSIIKKIDKRVNEFFLLTQQIKALEDKKTKLAPYVKAISDKYSDYYALINKMEKVRK